MGLYTYAGDVACPTCAAEPFTLCTYAHTPQNRKRKCVGQPIYQNGYPYYHNKRQYLQSEFSHTYVYGVNAVMLENWLRNYGDIFSEH